MRAARHVSANLDNMTGANCTAEAATINAGTPTVDRDARDATDATDTTINPNAETARVEANAECNTTAMNAAQCLKKPWSTSAVKKGGDDQRDDCNQFKTRLTGQNRHASSQCVPHEQQRQESRQRQEHGS